MAGLAVEERVCHHLASATRSDIPAPAAEQARRAILWWTATALEGSTEPEQELLRTFAFRQGGSNEATILGSPHRVPAEMAGMVNARAGKAFEHEDKFWANENIGVAIGCCVVPAAVAMAQARGAVCGRDLLTAVAIAIDVEARLIRPVPASFFSGRVPANATFAFGNYGAAAAAAKICALDAAGFSDALGLAHGQAAGNLQGQLEGRGVSIQCGFAVRSGVLAARLADQGLNGPQGWLTGRAGLYATHFPGSSVDLNSVLDELGQGYLGVNAAFKAYPCGIVAHPALDAVRSARSSIGKRAVRAVEVLGPTSLRIMADPIQLKRSPRTAVEAQFSIPWAIACVLRDDELTIDHYNEQSLASEELRRIAANVTVTLQEDARGTAVRIALSDGMVLEPAPVLIARGHPRNPLPTSEIFELFRRSASRAGVSRSDAERALAVLSRLDDAPDVDQIYSLLGGTLPGRKPGKSDG
jgi:2-methylcitrate dehydratase PrpD